MKLNLKSLILGFLTGITLMMSVPVMGYNGTRTIQAVYKNIRICIDGVEMTPRDSAGQVVEPFIYNGTTYLPIRAVGEAVGKEVTYDGSTSTVYLGKSGQVQYLGQQIEAYQTDGAYEETVTMGGESYLNGLSFNRYSGTRYAYYNLNGMYTSISGMYGMEDGTSDDKERTINFYGDGRLLESITVRGGELPKNFVVNITGVAQLKIEAADGRGKACLGNVEFK